MVTAEKSGSVRQFFNARRTAGTQALARLGLESYPAALARNTPAQLAGLAGSLPPDERNAFVHVIGEAQRVRAATEAMERSDAAAFGELLLQSHASLRDLLQVSCPALDSLVQCAVESKALGARLTGAGFGGCAVIFCERRHRPRLRRLLIRNFYSRFPEFREDRHLIDADPWHGVLYRT